MSKSIVIKGITVIQEQDGLYRLNALHEASGGEKRHQPNNWLRNKQTKALIAALKGEGRPITEIALVINGGDRRGTYVCRELVYAYAMWISPRLCIDAIQNVLPTEK